MKNLYRLILICLVVFVVLSIVTVSGMAQDKEPPKDSKAGCCMGEKKDGETMQGMKMGQGKMQGMQMGQGNMADMQMIHALFNDHEKISRQVKRIPKGIETITESNDPAVRKMIVEHVLAMYMRIENKQPIRQWDPLFAEIFKNTDKIKFAMEKTEKGVKVIETSDDPWVAQLIQSHADGVSEFVAVGMPAMHKEHPLPGKAPEARAFLGKGDGVTTCPVTGEPVNKNVSAEIFGRTVYFCCENCRDAVKKSPELYLKP